MCFLQSDIVVIRFEIVSLNCFGQPFSNSHTFLVPIATASCTFTVSFAIRPLTMFSIEGG